MKARLDMDKVARGLGGERQGKLEAKAGYFGAMQLLADVGGRLRAPIGGGRPTDPRWTERRLLPLTPVALKRLEGLAAKIRTDRGISIEPMQLAALIFERALEQVSTEEAEELAQPSKATGTARRRRGGG
jgi:hypothetical protein